MKAAFADGRGGVELREVEKPTAATGEVVIRLRVCGVCGTDLEKVRGHGITTAILGHEVVGDIVEVGEGLEEYHVGERVFVHHHVSCGRCYYCLNESPTMCPLFLKTNIQPCGFAEYFKVPAINIERGAVLKIPENLSYQDASFIEPLACCVRSMRRIRARAGESAAIIGFGPIGALYTLLLKASGIAFIAVADIAKFRIGMAENLGADAAVNLRNSSLADVCRQETGGRGVDFVIVATGNPAAYAEALKAVRKGGRIAVFGAPPRDATLQLNLAELFLREITIVPSYSTTEQDTSTALQLLASGRIKPSKLITHTYKLDRIADAFKVAANPEESMKVLVVQD